MGFTHHPMAKELWLRDQQSFHGKRIVAARFIAQFRQKKGQGMP